jgi:5,5'-dehydrodivanillate O-demethylase
MLTATENEFLTRVGPGTPAGELLRRYWHPIVVAQELTDESPTRFVRVLGEDLVLFRDKSGRVGLLADHCSHRGASLVYGRVEARGISCAYHGWLYDCEGNILETPPERNDAIMRSVKQKAYPVQKHVGLYWAYMGPEPAPVLSHYDTLFRNDVRRKIIVHPRLDCNWLQSMENSADPAHAPVLHQEFLFGRSRPDNTTRGLTDTVDYFDFDEVPYGIMKRRAWTNGILDQHPLIFPNILRQGESTQFRVPIDDTHTWHVFVVCSPSEDGRETEDTWDPPVEYMEPYKTPPDQLHPFTKFTMHHVLPQDHMAWETQGPIADRTIEHLAYSDRGIVMYRRMLEENIQRVQRGDDPICVMRDPDHEIIDTNLEEGLQQLVQMRQSATANR